MVSYGGSITGRLHRELFGSLTLNSIFVIRLILARPYYTPLFFHHWANTPSTSLCTWHCTSRSHAVEEFNYPWLIKCSLSFSFPSHSPVRSSAGAGMGISGRMKIWIMGYVTRMNANLRLYEFIYWLRRRRLLLVKLLVLFVLLEISKRNEMERNQHELNLLLQHFLRALLLFTFRCR